MGLFHIFKGDKKALVKKKSIFDCQTPIDKSSYFQVFSACLGKVLANQIACSELVVKGQQWNVDFTKEVITIGTDSYPLQFIGSESTYSNT